MTKKESSEEVLKQLRARVAKIPKKSGIYRWLDSEGTILYVGKAKDLQSRLRSYLSGGTPAEARRSRAKAGPWKRALLERIADFDYTVTKNELEALILETNLIKEVRPKFNVLMKDDKNYVYIKITEEDPYPLLAIERQMDEPRERTSTVLSTGSALLRGGSPRVKRPNGRHAALYFGPFLSGHDLRSTLDLLHTIFRWRACKRSIDALNRASMRASTSAGATQHDVQLKPCIEQQIGRCNGLCTGTITQEEYRRRITQVVRFFRGNHKEVIERLKVLMQEAAIAKQFEKAAKLRDTLEYVRSLEEQQVVSGTSGENTDIFGLALLRSRAQVALLKERGGKVVQELSFSLQGEASQRVDVLAQFLPQYYSDTLDIPDTVVVPSFSSSERAMRANREVPLDQSPPRLRPAGKLEENLEGEFGIISAWLTQRKGSKVSITSPQRGKKSKLLQMADANALEKVQQQFARWEAEEARVERALQELQTALALSKLPERIECYDISHLSGTETVGSMVVTLEGKAKNDHYRSFTIRTMRKGEIDDYKALREVLTRRLRHLTEGMKEWLRQIPIALEKKGKLYVIVHHALESTYAERGFRYVQTFPRGLKEKMEEDTIVMMLEKKKNKPDPSLTAHPDLLVLDGGKGQLGVGIEVLKHMNLEIPVIALAKEREEVFTFSSSESRGHGTSREAPQLRSGQASRPRTFAESAGLEENIQGPISIPEEARYLLMRLRDEAHRFANRHRERRAKHAMVV